jgi:hypothetical protein
MAGLIGGVAQAFGHLGGSSAKTDRSNQLTAFSDLKNTFNWALPFAQQQGRAGQTTTQAGLQNLGQAGSYFGKLASGDRPTALQAIAPETNAALAQSDAQKQQLGQMGTARGGGAVGVNQQRDTDLMGKIDNMLFGAQGAGAQALAGVGQAQAGVGLGQSGQGIQAGGLAEGAASDLGKQALYSRQVSDEMHRKAVGDFANAFGSVMGLPFGDIGKAFKGMFNSGMTGGGNTGSIG